MVRTIFSSRITRRQKLSMLCYDVRGSGFLHHMVRNIVGTLIEVGRAKLAPEDILRILKARDRTAAGPTAPPQGLCLMKVEY
jgi:tRNA pseudouridine38-40 synthase